MATLTVNCGSFNKTSYNGVTQYGSIVNFSIPAGATITGCSVSFTTHAASGQTNDRAFSLNGARAHSGWPSTGMSLDAGLLSPGGNTFRVSLRSQTASGSEVVSCTWSISSITLHITYTEAGTPTHNPGTVSISKTSLTAGESLTVSVSGASDGVYRNVYIRRILSGDNLLVVAAQHGSGAGSWAVTIPTSWCTTLSPDAPSFELRVYMVAYIAGSIQVGEGTKMLTVNVPTSFVPTIGSFGASRIVNNTPAGIADYVQNVSGVSLAMSGASGAYGSTISAYKITGAGYTFNASSGSIPVLSISGNIAFTAEVTDSRGRKATKVVYINVLAYIAVSASNIAAYRSDANKNKADEGVFATLRAKMVVGSLDGQNTGEIKGRVYEKGTTPPAWTTMANDTLVLFGGSLSIEKVYTADIRVADLITSYQYSIDIPTATVIMGVAPDGDGVSFGTYPEAGIVKSAWPIVAPNLYPVGAIYISYASTSPATLFGGTWTSLGGRMLIGVNSTYTVGSTGGSATHTLTASEMPAHGHDLLIDNHSGAVGNGSGAGVLRGGTSNLGRISSPGSQANLADSIGQSGSNAAHNNMPPYLAVYMWRRTA